VLPFPECPAAALAVGDLVGCDLAELSRSVPDLLTGIRSCTHLNDLLRALGGRGRPGGVGPTWLSASIVTTWAARHACGRQRRVVRQSRVQ
jgi:hypothetical protein